MRALILITAAGWAIAGCSQDESAETAVNVDAVATANGISSNDTTAIDAATGDDANMAADVNYIVNDVGNDANVGGTELDENNAGNSD